MNNSLLTNINNAYNLILGRSPSEQDVISIYNHISDHQMDYSQFILSLFLSTEYTDKVVTNAQIYHLQYVHHIRLKLIRYLLPPARIILDIGGANGSLVDYGYSYQYDRLIIADLPAEDRIVSLQNIDMAKKYNDSNITIIYTSMTDLSMIEDNSIDLVWVGQVIEHISEIELSVALKEIYRVLKNNGTFCFDTPNALVTRIHSPDKLIHPEHKKEYTPVELRQLLSPLFIIVSELGLIPMPESYDTKIFSYREMILNSAFSSDIDCCYLMYFSCRKRL